MGVRLNLTSLIAGTRQQKSISPQFIRFQRICKKPATGYWLRASFNIIPGGDLLLHTATRAVSSAPRGLTSVLVKQSQVNYCVTGLVPHLSSALPRAPAWAPATSPYPAIFVPGLVTLVPAAHAVQLPAAASDPSMPVLAAEEGFGPGLVSERFHPPGALAATLVPAAHAVQPPAAASDPSMPVLAAEGGVGPGLVSERFRHPGVVAASVCQLDRPAGVALNAGYPAVLDFLSEALPAFPAEQVRALFVL
jgi:hypothetical protein